MLRPLQNITNGHNWLYIYIRLSIMVVSTIVIFIQQNRTWFGLESISDMFPAIATTLGLTLVLLIPTYIRQLRAYFAYIALPGDWIIAGVWVYLVATDQMIIIGIISLIVLNGLLRFGSGWGTLQVIGVLITTGVALYQNPAVGEYALLNDTMRFVPGLLLAIFFAIVSGLWSNWRDDNNSRINRDYRKRMEENDFRVDSMHERTQGIAELGTRLNATFDYDKILDTTLDIGRLSLRNQKNERIVSMILLVADGATLKIETSRGINYLDENRTFKGESGILGRAFQSGQPLIETIGEKDSELGAMIAFKNIVSTLVIPLRAGYDTYGALVYGSTDDKAFNEDTLDTLKAIATQATIALHNSVLYHSLNEEKERIIAIEERARQELVRDLHDVPTQTMSAVAMRVGNLKRMLEKRPDQMQQEITNIHNMAKRATDEIRHVMFSLRPLSLETQGLTVALKQLIEKNEKTYGQKIKTQISPYTEILLSDKQQGALFYLAEEALNNARKYANASLVRLIITLEENALKFIVVDNGDGFNSDAINTNYEQRGSFGMVNMSERAELIGGVFELKSTPGIGTTVTVRVPVDTSNLPVLSEKGTDLSEDKSPLLLKPHRKSKKRYTGPLSPNK